MPHYNTIFAHKLAETADLVLQHDSTSVEAHQTALYLSLLACELTLKALLEAAGQPIATIRARSHDLAGLLGDLDRCDVTAAVIGNSQMAVSASRLRAVTLDSNFANATVGTILIASTAGATSYPSGIRYGSQISHYPVKLVVGTAKAVLAWADEHCTNIRKVR